MKINFTDVEHVTLGTLIKDACDLIHDMNRIIEDNKDLKQHLSKIVDELKQFSEKMRDQYCE